MQPDYLEPPRSFLLEPPRSSLLESPLSSTLEPQSSTRLELELPHPALLQLKPHRSFWLELEDLLSAVLEPPCSTLEGFPSPALFQLECHC